MAQPGEYSPDFWEEEVLPVIAGLHPFMGRDFRADTPGERLVGNITYALDDHSGMRLCQSCKRWQRRLTADDEESPLFMSKSAEKTGQLRRCMAQGRR